MCILLGIPSSQIRFIKRTSLMLHLISPSVFIFYDDRRRVTTLCMRTSCHPPMKWGLDCMAPLQERVLMSKCLCAHVRAMLMSEILHMLRLSDSDLCTCQAIVSVPLL